MSVQRLAFTFRDNAGKQSETGIWLPVSLDVSSMLAAANLFRSVLLPVTNASLVGARWVYDVHYDDAPPPSFESDVSKRIVLIYTNGQYRRSITLPSPAELPLDATGTYSGIRLQRDRAMLFGLLPLLELIPTIIRDEQGRVFPSIFSVAGVTRI